MADDAAHDAAVAAFWLRHLLTGILLYGGGIALVVTYLVLTPDGPNRGVLWALAVVACLVVTFVASLPRERIARSRHALVFFVAWTVFTCQFVTAIAALDGGVASPVTMLLMVSITYASLAYPARLVLAVGTLGALDAVFLGFVGGTTSRTLVLAGAVLLETVLAASVARERKVQDDAREALTAELTELAVSDGLTGCLNHRGLYQRLEAELARLPRSGQEFCLLLADIDDFKGVNDTHGHLEGDRVLRDVAGALRRVARSSDAVGRLGGDEFAVVLVGADAVDGAQAVERFAAEVAAGDVRVSVGLAHVASSDAQLSAGDVVARADAALYGMKRARRTVA